MEKEKESLAQITRKAYVMGYALLDTTLDEEAIYAKIEKQQIPEKIAKQVAADIILERQKRDAKEERPHFILAVIMVSLAFVGAILSYIFTDHLVLFFGFILSGGLYIIRYYKKKPKQ